jgi:hypothetical protein
MPKLLPVPPKAEECFVYDDGKLKIMLPNHNVVTIDIQNGPVTTVSVFDAKSKSGFSHAMTPEQLAFTFASAVID